MTLDRLWHSEVVRFGLLGLANTAFGFGLFALLLHLFADAVPYLVLLIGAHVVSVLEAYVVQRTLVFRVVGGWWRRLFRFWSVYLVALAINLVALPLLVEVGGLPILPAQALVLGGTALASFAAHSRFTFRGRLPGADAPHESGRGPVKCSG